MIIKTVVSTFRGVRYVEAHAYARKRLIARSVRVPLLDYGSMRLAEEDLHAKLSASPTYKTTLLERRLSVEIDKAANEKSRDFLIRHPVVGIARPRSK